MLNSLNGTWATERPIRLEVINSDDGHQGKYFKTLVEPELVIGETTGKRSLHFMIFHTRYICSLITSPMRFLFESDNRCEAGRTPLLGQPQLSLMKSSP